MTFALLHCSFAADGNGVVDFAELVSGLSVLCGGSRDDKVKAAFELYDTRGDGLLDPRDLTAYLSAVFKVLYETNRSAHAQVDVDATELALATTKAAFTEATTAVPGRISLSEFTAWYSTAPPFEVPVGGAGVSEVAREERAAPAGEPMSLKRARWLLNLDKHALNDLLDTLVEAGPEGSLTRDQFSNALLLLVRLGGNLDTRTAEYGEAAALVARLFEAFSGGGAVDLSMVTSGLSILCDVPMAEKISFAFAL